MDVLSYKGPLKEGSKVAIIGGGPGGCSVALTLIKIARKKNINLDITMYEPKEFGFHYNQCIGVLSPPLEDILLDDLGIKVPESMIQRRIEGYVLHGGGEAIELEEAGGDAIAVRRVELDSFLLEKVRETGIRIIASKVTAVEVHDAGACVFSESGQVDVDVVFGCYGLDPVLSQHMRRYAYYRDPDVIDTLVTRFEASEEHLQNVFKNKVQAFLPPIEGVEFAALTPKANHISMVLSGHKVRTESVRMFVNTPLIRSFLPMDAEIGKIYKGAFPSGPAKGFYDDRFVTVGDAAGLIRPFKGKGINSAILTGAAAARTAANVGISRRAFANYKNECNYIIKDYSYGQMVRMVTNFISHHLSLGPVIRLAKKNEAFKWALAMSVTGGASYKDIFFKCMRPSISIRLLGHILFWPFMKKGWDQ